MNHRYVSERCTVELLSRGQNLWHLKLTRRLQTHKWLKHMSFLCHWTLLGLSHLPVVYLYVCMHVCMYVCMYIYISLSLCSYSQTLSRNPDDLGTHALSLSHSSQKRFQFSKLGLPTFNVGRLPLQVKSNEAHHA